ARSAGQVRRSRAGRRPRRLPAGVQPSPRGARGARVTDPRGAGARGRGGEAAVRPGRGRGGISRGRGGYRAARRGGETRQRRRAAVQERRAALGRLIRAYGAASGDVAAVLDWAKQAGSRLAELEGAEDMIAALAAEEASLRAEVASRAGQLTALRSAAAERFA